MSTHRNLALAHALSRFGTELLSPPRYHAENETADDGVGGLCGP
jgi:hypothetical protein